MLRGLLPVLAVMISPIAVAGNLSLTLYFSNGSLPPPHHFHYRIDIDAEGAAELAYTRGYTNPPRTATYTVVPEILAALERQARALAAVRDSFAAAEALPRPIGGATTHARILLDGEELVLPTTFNQPHAGLLNDFYGQIRQSVPATVWKAVQQAADPIDDR